MGGQHATLAANNKGCFGSYILGFRVPLVRTSGDISLNNNSYYTLEQRLLNYKLRPQMVSWSEIMGSRKLNPNTWISIDMLYNILRDVPRKRRGNKKRLRRHYQWCSDNGCIFRVFRSWKNILIKNGAINVKV